MAPATPSMAKKALPSPAGSSIKKKKNKNKQKQKSASPVNAAEMERKKALKLRNLPFVPQNKDKVLRAKQKQLEKKLKIKQERQAAQATSQPKKKPKKKKKKAGADDSVVADEVKEESEGEQSEKKKRLEKVAKFREKLLNHPVQKLIRKGLAPSDDKMRKNVVKAVAAVIAASKHAGEAGGKKELFDDPADVRVFLRATMFKLPKLRSTIKAILPHPFLLRGPGELPAEVCLFVKDLERGPKSDPEEAVQHYEELLSSKGVEVVKRIIPMREIRNEFNHFKLRTGLARQYDAYLADQSILPMVGGLLGKEFAKLGARRLIGVDMTAEDLKAEFHHELSKAHMPWKPTSDQASMWIGCSSQPQNHLVENAAAAIDAVKKAVKGGWSNIKSLGLQTNISSLMVPIYVSMSSGNLVKVDTTRKGAKENGVFGPLTTQPGTTIAIDDHGQIKVERTPVERPKSKTPITPPLTMIPSLEQDGKKKKKDDMEVEEEEIVDEDFDVDDEEMKEPGKLVKLEHAFLKRKMMAEQKDTEEKEAAEGEEKDEAEESESETASPGKSPAKDDLNASSSLSGIKKRKKRKRKVNVQPLAASEPPATSTPAPAKASPSPQRKRKQQTGATPPKSPTPDYSVSNVEETAEEETPKKKKKRMSEEKGKVTSVAKPKSPTPNPSTPQQSGKKGKKGKKSVTPQQPSGKKPQQPVERATPQQQSPGKKGQKKPDTSTPQQSVVKKDQETPKLATPQESAAKKGKQNKGMNLTPQVPSGVKKVQKTPKLATPQQSTAKLGKQKKGMNLTPQVPSGAKKIQKTPELATPQESAANKGKLNKGMTLTPQLISGANKIQKTPKLATPQQTTANKAQQNRRMTQTPQVPSGGQEGAEIKGKKRPRSILKRTSTVVTPAKAPGKPHAAKASSPGSAGKAEHGRRVRFSLPKDQQKKNKRRTMF